MMAKPFTEREFLLALDNQTRQLWAERWLEDVSRRPGLPTSGTRSVRSGRDRGEFRIPPRTHDVISPKEVYEILMSQRAQDPRLEASCDWKTRTVPQVALTIQQRFEAALACQSGSLHQEDEVNWVLCASRDIDRTLAKKPLNRYAPLAAEEVLDK